MKNFLHVLICIFIFNIFSTSSNCYAYQYNWKKVFNIDQMNFIGIDNPDSNYCMAIATNVSWKSIVKTTDGGETWYYVHNDSLTSKWKKYGRDISYPSRDFCIIGLDSSSFLKTTDGGVTWEEYKIEIPFTNFGFYDVDMYDENHGVLASQKYLAVSHDGFKTWDTISAPGGYYIFCIEMAAPNSICVLSRDVDGSSDFNERFFRSDDGGKTWDEYPHPDYRIPQELQFVDSLNGFEVGGKSTGVGQQQYELIFRTTDGGRTWEKVLDTVIGCSFGLQKLDFYDKDNGIAVGQCGAIFWTHDGGKSWYHDWDSSVMEHTPATMNVCYVRKDRAILCDFLGRIFISEDTTTDVLEEIPIDDDFSLYSNPASDKIKIRLKDEYINTIEIKIFNSYGQEIINKFTSNSGLPASDFRLLELDISSLSTGVYFAVLNGNGKVITKPFLLMR